MPSDGKRKRRNKSGDPVRNSKGKNRKHHNQPKVGSKSENVILTYTRKKSFHRRREGEGNSLRGRNIVKKAIQHKTKFSKKQLSSGSREDEPARITSDDGLKNINSLQSCKRQKKRKKRKDDLDLDETSRLQRRTRYLLIKVKREQNLIDAYSAEGWKGHSREKIKPDKELERAKAQILKCKLGIREAIRQMDLLSSKGHIDDSAIAPDGSVHHEHIICAKCNLREAFPDNDIILCDGTCNCAFHQKCLDPPLTSENIPPEDEGWFCRYCKGKIEILDATNAHLGTNFSMDSNWQDIFKEEALLPDGGASNILHIEEWPSDDSEDVDYDPERGKSSSSDAVAASESDASGHANSSSSFRSLDDDVFFLLGRPERLETDGTNDQEVVLFQPRPRTTVDYIKLNDELFGKYASLTEQISEDEEWGPTRRKRRRKEPDGVSTPMISDEIQGNSAEENVTGLKRRRNDKRPIFRFPHSVVEKLRSVFVAENELPSRAIREDLSVQLGIEAEKVNKWFKNARYLALKARKKARSSDSRSPITEEDISTASRMDNNADEVSSRDVTLSCEEESPETSMWRKQNEASLVQDSIEDFSDDVSLKYLREKARKKKLDSKSQKDMLKAETEMKRLCQMKGKLEKLQEVVQRLISRKSSKPPGPPILKESCVVYVPVAELREKR